MLDEFFVVVRTNSHPKPRPGRKTACPLSRARKKTVAYLALANFSPAFHPHNQIRRRIMRHSLLSLPRLNAPAISGILETYRKPCPRDARGCSEPASKQFTKAVIRIVRV